MIELIGNPMPGGGFVMSFTDITEFREAERALKDANESLERRVAERTQELSKLNQALTEAKAHAEAAGMFEGDKRSTYQKLKLEGIVESPVGICITCDRERTGPVVVGRTHMKTMDLYSSVCAVQNLWLAARAEGLGVGWVSIFHQADLQEALGIPKGITPIAYLCVGYVSHFHACLLYTSPSPRD